MKLLPLLALLAIVAYTYAVIEDSENEVAHSDWLSKYNKVAYYGHHRPGHHHRHHWPMPPFLRKVSRRARREFFRIVTDKTTSMREKGKRLDEWAKKQGDDILEDLHDYEKKVAKYFARLHENTTDTLAHLPDTYAKVFKIFSDIDLTPKEAYEKLKALKLSSTIVRSLRAVSFIIQHPRHCPRKHGNCANEDDEDQLFKVLPGYGVKFGTDGGHDEVNEEEDSLTVNDLE